MLAACAGADRREHRSDRARPGPGGRPGTSASALRAAGTTTDAHDDGSGWEQLDVVDGDVAWSVAVSVDRSGLARSVRLAMAAPQEQTTWNDWSLEVELARRDRHDAWLTGQLGEGWATERWAAASTGSGARHPWGRVVSDYDERSGCSTITVDWRPDGG